MRTSPPLLAPLFRSEGQAALLAALLLGDDELGLTELAAKAGVPRSSAHREVTRLVDAGLLRVKMVGREWQVSANSTSPLTGPVRQILLAAYGPAVMLTKELQQLNGVDYAAIFGSYAARATGVAGPAPKDIDVLVIGNVDISALYAATRRVGSAVGRPINPTVMDANEWVAAVATDNVFVRDVISNPTIPLLGELP